MFPKEPPVPCTGADKPFKIDLELTNAAGEKVTPPRGFKVQATLHIEGSHSPLTADEVMWAQRGSAPPRRKERLLRLSIGNADNVFEMKESQLALSAHIYPYSSEVQKRKLVDPLHGRLHESVTALSIAVNNMSRTPNSRKNKTPPGLPALTYTGPAVMAKGTPVVDPSAGAAPPSGLVTPLPALQPVAPGRANSERIEDEVSGWNLDDLVNDFINASPRNRRRSGSRSAARPAGTRLSCPSAASRRRTERRAEHARGKGMERKRRRTARREGEEGGARIGHVWCVCVYRNTRNARLNREHQQPSLDRPAPCSRCYLPVFPKPGSPAFGPSASSAPRPDAASMMSSVTSPTSHSRSSSQMIA